MFGWSQDDTGVLIIRDAGSIGRTVVTHSDAPDYERFEAEGHVVHSWSSIEHEEIKQVFVVHSPNADGTETAIVGGSMRSLVRALKVRNGDAPGCGVDVTAPMLALPGDGSIFYFSASDPGDVPVGDAGAGFAGAESVLVDLGERGDRAYGVLTVSAPDADTAERISAGVTGLSMLATALLPDDTPDAKALRSLLSGLRVTPEGQMVNARCEVDVAMLGVAGDSDDGVGDNPAH